MKSIQMYMLLTPIFYESEVVVNIDDDDDISNVQESARKGNLETTEFPLETEEEEDDIVDVDINVDESFKVLNAEAIEDEEPKSSSSKSDCPNQQREEQKQPTVVKAEVEAMLRIRVDTRSP
ncbi:unnamed protein product [Cochlearia groenlandica]